jgi:hypothetical protein
LEGIYYGIFACEMIPSPKGERRANDSPLPLFIFYKYYIIYRNTLAKGRGLCYNYTG